jgi:hypothetical protein
MRPLVQLILEKLGGRYCATRLTRRKFFLTPAGPSTMAAPREPISESLESYLKLSEKVRLRLSNFFAKSHAVEFMTKYSGMAC